jgi:hypothetical protein
VSVRSRQREKEKGKGWNPDERHAYLERKRQKRFTSEFRARPQTSIKTIEQPIDNEEIDFDDTP